MTPREQESITALCLMAALADGTKSDAERAKLKEVFDGLEVASAPAVYQRVLLKKTDLAAEAAALESSEARTLAYEMAVHVCDADGTTTPAEAEFLGSLRRALGLGETETAPVLARAEAIAATPLEAGPAAPAADAEVDGMIVRYAILNGALELLPQSIATMAILPLQMKMVYRIGARYGYPLDRGHVKEFLATVGVGLGAQVLEGYARNLLGGLLKKTLGKTAAKIGKAAVGPALSFATTWALGQVARSYYGGGRTLDVPSLKSLFASKVQEGRALFPRYEGQVIEQARNVNVTDLVGMVRGG
jgi:uncharacterized protein (DUF697 family)/uncharacterized tellurite resistance protein B-like protein